MDLGFKPQNVVRTQFDVNQAGYANNAAADRFERQLLERVSQIPGVEAAGYANTTPLGLDASLSTVFSPQSIDFRSPSKAFDTWDFLGHRCAMPEGHEAEEMASLAIAPFAKESKVRPLERSRRLPVAGLKGARSQPNHNASHRGVHAVLLVCQTSRKKHTAESVRLLLPPRQSLGRASFTRLGKLKHS